MTQSFADPGVPQSPNGGSTRTATVELNANVAGYTNQLNQAAQSTGALSNSVDALTNKMSGLNKWAGRKLFHFAAADFSVLAAATGDAATFEKQLSTLAATAAVTGTSLHGISRGIENAFTKFPVARGDVIQLVEAITNLGVTSSRDIGSLTQTFIKLGAATGEPMTQLASGLIQLSRLMGTTDATQIGNYANSLLTVSKNAGVSASGVLQFAQSIAPIARQAGIGEAAVIGISTAFSKAGADGFVATNTFNSMLTDISNSIATGSPELNKYANLLGITGKQLASMDKSDAMVRILQAISKQGPQAVAVLNDLGIEGIRAQSAIAAITQSGDLQRNINDAINAQSNQGNLNKGANAAFDNLASSLSRVRNQFTQFGAEIGTVFLGPMTAAANIAATVAHHLNLVAAPFAPIIAGVGVVAGGAAGIGSLALNAAGVIGAYALYKNVRQSNLVKAFQGGTAVGGPREDIAMGEKYARGGMGRSESAGYVVGTGFRRGLARIGITPAGMTSPFRDPVVLRNMGATGILPLARLLSRQQEQFVQGDFSMPLKGVPMMQRLTQYGESLRGKTMLEAAAQETKPLAAQLGATARAEASLGVGLAGRILHAGWQFAGPTVLGALVGGTTGIPGAGRLANAGRGALPTGSISAEYAGLQRAGSALGTAVRGIRDDVVPLRVGFSAVGNASRDLASSLLRTTGTIAGAGIGATVGGIGRGLGAGVRFGGAAVGAAMRGMFSLPGMVGLLGGHYLWDKASQANARADMTPMLNPIQRYNDMLGTTTTNLAVFGQGLSANASALQAMQSLTIKQATSYGNSDAALAPKTPINPVWNTLSSAKDPVALAQSILSSMPIASGGQLRLAEQDMTAAGLSKQQVNQVINNYMAAGGPSKTSGLGSSSKLALQGQAAAAAEKGGITSGLTTTETKVVATGGLVAGGAALGAAAGSPLFGIGAAPGALIGAGLGYVGSLFGGASKAASQFHVNPSQASLQLNANMLSGIGAQQVSDTNTRGGAYADQRAFASYMTGLGPEINAIGKGGQSGERQSRAVAAALDEITGGGKKDYFNSLQGQNLSTNMGAAAQWNAIKTALGKSSKGKQYLARLNTEGVDLTSPQAAQANLINLANTNDGSNFNAKLRTYGRLGQFAAGDKGIQAAISTKLGDAGAQYDAAKALEKTAEARPVDIFNAPYGARAQAALQQKVTDGYAGAIAKLTMFSAQVGDATGALGKLAARATAEEMEKQQLAQPYQSRSTNLVQAAQTYKQTAIQFNTAKATGGLMDVTDAETNMKAAKANFDNLLGAEQSYNEQVILTVAQFHEQQKRAGEDYSHSKLLQQNAYQLQSQYSLQDFQLQQSRTIEDHNRQLAEQAQTAAQSIYDPYQRIQAKYTLSGTGVSEIMEDQNKRLAQQMKDIAKLRREGVSLSTIQTLNLADPNNAAQAANLASSTDPRTARRLNRDAAQRQSLTRDLTQSPANLAFAQSQHDYQTGLDRSSHDFTTQVNRAAKQEAITLKEMAFEFGRSTDRAAKDLSMATRIISGSFDHVKAQAIAAANTIADVAPGAAKTWRDAFKQDNVIDELGLSDPNKLITAGTAAGKAILQGLKDGTGSKWTISGYIVALDAGKSTASPGAPSLIGASKDKTVGVGEPAPPPAHPKNAAGGIATRAQLGIYGEAGPEALIPLNDRGQSFMAGLMVKAFGQVMTMSGPSSSSTRVDSSTNFTGDVTVVAQDTRAFEREMKAKARLRKLTSPSRH